MQSGTWGAREIMIITFSCWCWCWVRRLRGRSHENTLLRKTHMYCIVLADRPENARDWNRVSRWKTQPSCSHVDSEIPPQRKNRGIGENLLKWALICEKWLKPDDIWLLNYTNFTNKKRCISRYWVEYKKQWRRNQLIQMSNMMFRIFTDDQLYI